MKTKRSKKLIILLNIFLSISIYPGTAQTPSEIYDREIYYKYVKACDYTSNFNSTSPLDTPDSLHLRINNSADLKHAMSADARDKVTMIRLPVSDLSSFNENILQISQFPNLKYLQISDKKNLITKLPEAMSSLQQLRIIELNSLANVDMPDAITKLGHIPNLRGIIVSNYFKPLPASISNLNKISFIGLNSTNLEGLDLKTIKWKILALYAGGKRTISPETAKCLIHMDSLKRVDLINFNIDSAFLERGYVGKADLKVLFDEMGIVMPGVKVSEQDYAFSLTNFVSSFSRPGTYKKAVEFADKAKATDQAIYEKNIWWPTIAIARLATKDYSGAISDANTYLERGPFGYIDGGQNMTNAEWCKTQAYLALGQKELAAETYAYFGRKTGRPYSYLNAALQYLELKNEVLYNKYMDSTVLTFAKDHAYTVSYGNPSLVYEYAEVLIMAGKSPEALTLFAGQPSALFEDDKSVKCYLEAVAALLQDPASFEQIKKALLADIAKNGKITDWYFRRFNSWIQGINKPKKLKHQLYALQAIAK